MIADAPRPPVPPRPIRLSLAAAAQLHAQRLLDAERHVLGAVLTGALRLADLARAPDELCGHLHHRRLLARLTLLLEMRADGRKLPGAPGIDWRFAERACASPRIWPIGIVSIAPPVLCGLLDLARAAPRRPTALAALQLVSADARHRADRASERERLRAVLDDVVEDLTESYLAAALEETKGGTSALLTARGRTVYVGADVLREELARHRRMPIALDPSTADVRRLLAAVKAEIAVRKEASQ